MVARDRGTPSSLNSRLRSRCIAAACPAAQTCVVAGSIVLRQLCPVPAAAAFAEERVNDDRSVRSESAPQNDNRVADRVGEQNRVLTATGRGASHARRLTRQQDSAELAVLRLDDRPDQ